MVYQLDKERIARCFRRSLLTYDDEAVVQNRLAIRLLQSLECLPESAFYRVLEIGCCTGNLSEMLCDRKPVATLFLNDLVADFENTVTQRLSQCSATAVVPCFGDIETATLPPNLSLVVSGATLQWLTNLPEFFRRIGRELQSGSYLVFSLFGDGTLKEMSSLTPIKLQYSSDREVLSMLEHDFKVEAYEQYDDQLMFKSVQEILSHIRATGIGGVGEYKWNKESLKRFIESYKKQFATEKGLPVSYVSSCYVARKR